VIGAAPSDAGQFSQVIVGSLPAGTAGRCKSRPRIVANGFLASRPNSGLLTAGSPLRTILAGIPIDRKSRLQRSRSGLLSDPIHTQQLIAAAFSRG
jgi:hypothetical protein